MRRRRHVAIALGASRALVGLLVGCSSSNAPAPAPAPRLQIVTATGAPLHAFAGDALALEVVVAQPDGSTQALPAGAGVTWTSPGAFTSLPPNSTAPSPLPAAGPTPTVGWIDNPYRPDQSIDLANALFVLDPGTGQNSTVTVSATVTGATPAGNVTASVGIDPTPEGSWTRGATLYGPGGASCSICHGPTGHGSPTAPEATTYTIAGATYDFPTPGINAEPGNTAGDPAWNAALFAVASRADMDNGGITLRLPMPDWLTQPNPATGQPLATQDLADIYAFLKTQTH